MMVEKPSIKMSSFKWGKNIEDSIKDELIMAATTMVVVYVRKVF